MKVAGSSVEAVLYKYLGEKDVVGNNGVDNIAILRGLGKTNRISKHSHMSMRDVLYSYDWPCVSYVHFSIVRNPWDRAVSLFYWRNRELRDAPLKAAQAAFRKWVTFGLIELGEHRLDWNGYPLADIIVKYEDLNQGMRQVSRLLDLDPEIDTDEFQDKANVRPAYSRSFMDLYDDESWALVGQVLAWDRMLFDYSAERPSGREASVVRFAEVAKARRRHLKIDHGKALAAAKAGPRLKDLAAQQAQASGDMPARE